MCISSEQFDKAAEGCYSKDAPGSTAARARDTLQTPTTVASSWHQQLKAKYILQFLKPSARSMYTIMHVGDSL
jgi:hypothetical protein